MNPGSRPVPTITAIIATYNRAHLVSRAIRSVLAQTYGDFELIVVDDGSNDNTRQIVGSFEDPRIRYVRHGNNKGAAAAYNTGVRESRGEYFAVLGDDDEWLPKMLEMQLALFRESKVSDLGVVTCGVTRVRADGVSQFCQDIVDVHGWVYQDLLNLKWIPCQITLLIRRGCLEGVLFDEQLPAMLEWDLCLQLSKNVQFDSRPEPLVRVYEHSGIRITRSDAPWRVWKCIREKYCQAFAKYPKAHANISYTLSRAYLAGGNILSARRELLASLKLDPWHPQRWMFLACMFAGRKFSNWIHRKYARFNSRIGRSVAAANSPQRRIPL